MKASAAAECPHLIGGGGGGEEWEGCWMDRGHSSPSTEAFFRTGTIVLSQGQRGEKEDEIEFLRKESWHSIEPFLKTPHITLKVALFLNALFIYIFFKTFLQVSIHYVSELPNVIPAWLRNEWAKTGLFTPRIFWPYLGSFDSAARLSLRPGSLRAWIFSLLGRSRALRQQVLLMMENYACATPITMQKLYQAAFLEAEHFLS